MAWMRMLKQRFGIAAPRVAVRPHVPWYWRWLGILTIGGLAAGAGWATYDRGIMFPGTLQEHSGPTLSHLHETITRQEKEIGELRARAVLAERQLAIDKATYSHLALQIKLLTEQNAALKEDIAFFQTLMPSGGGTRGIMVERFRLHKEALPGEYRFRLFLVQTGQRDKDFEGRVQLVVNVAEKGGTRVLTLPPETEREAREYQLKFKFFQHIEGTFRVSSDAPVGSVQVRVYERGSNAPKLAHTVNAT